MDAPRNPPCQLTSSYGSAEPRPSGKSILHAHSSPAFHEKPQNYSRRDHCSPSPPANQHLFSLLQMVGCGMGNLHTAVDTWKQQVLPAHLSTQLGSEQQAAILADNLAKHGFLASLTTSWLLTMLTRKWLHKQWHTWACLWPSHMEAANQTGPAQHKNLCALPSPSSCSSWPEQTTLRQQEQQYIHANK